VPVCQPLQFACCRRSQILIFQILRLLSPAHTSAYTPTTRSHHAPDSRLPEVFAGYDQEAWVAAHNIVSTAIGEDHLAFAGRNDAGRWMTFPDGRPSTWSTPSLVIT